MTRALPLIVDLDGTLFLTDTLVESLAERLFRAPIGLLATLPSLMQGRAAFKARVDTISALDIEVLPVREDLMGYLEAEKKNGRAIHLVTAANQAIADAVAERFGLFDSATGSSDTHNLKGVNKQAWLRQQFPDGYVYAGDSAADLSVWKDADGIILAGASASTTRLAEMLDAPIEARFENSGGARIWLKALRLHQWAKNLLLIAPLLLSGLYADLTVLPNLALAFFGLGLAASGTYLLNDLVDLSADRRHRSKRLRPFASGKASLGLGMLAAPALILAGMLLALFASPLAAMALACYLVVTLSYSFSLKRKPLLDVVLLAVLFTLRLVIGAVAIGAETSYWLFTFSMFFFLSLSLAKRHVEVAAAEPGSVIRGRGYRPEDAPLTLSLGISSAMAAIVILCLYVIEDAFPDGRYGAPEFLMVAPAMIGIWTLRIWLLAHRGELDDDPVSFAVKDRISLGLGVILVAMFLAASVL
ncbi:UbiA family prenyltransferase [Maricaulis sp.]|uniref:UbiA family prenyltransferase n=1 Tax=Maricaulis sp. TaxID=1486257 RepID=UPI0025BF76F1|nr:UbiA family prenyltransferase [Maricaulis sp.]